MSNEEPKFMKPGDDPELDRALNELRFDSGLYEAGDYDMFGRRRGLTRAPDAEGSDSPPAPPAAPVVADPPAQPVAKPGRVKPITVLLAICAAIAPVAIFATVWHPPRVPSGAPSSASAASTVSALPMSSEPVRSVPPPPPAASVAPTAAPSVEATAHPTSAPAPKGTPSKRSPEPRGALEDPYRDASPPSPPPQVTATPSVQVSTPPPPPPPEPTIKPVF